MKKWIWMLATVVALNVVLPALGPELPGVQAFEHVAFAQSTPDGLTRLETKLRDLQALIMRLLYVFTALGIAFAGFRFIQGDPNAWKYTLTVVIGATIIFASAEIMTWLER